MESSTPDPKWVGRIAKLLAMAEDPGATEAEAQAHQAMALRLMTQKGIEEALVRGHNPAAIDDPLVMVTIEIPPPFSDAQANMFGRVAELMGCSVVVHRMTNVNRATKRTTTVGPRTLRLIGRQSLTQDAIILVRSLNIQCLTGLARNEGYTRAYRRAYVFGFGAGCIERLEAIKSDEISHLDTPDADRYALVVQDDKAKAQALLRQQFPDLSQGRALTFSSHAGREAGLRDGLRADLGQRRVGESRSAIGS